jgi:hypothetical protein
LPGPAGSFFSKFSLFGEKETVVQTLKGNLMEEPLMVDTFRPAFPGEIATLIHQMLVKDPQRRPAAAEAAGILKREQARLYATGNRTLC